MTSKTKKSNLISLAVLSLVTPTSIAVNILFFKIPSYTLLLYSCGALAYFIFIKLSRFQLKKRIDYIQSGDAAIITFIIFFAIKFITSNIYLIFLITAATVTLFRYFFHIVINFKDMERFFLGLMINVIIIILFTFFAIYDSTFNPDELKAVALGYGHSGAENIYIVITILIIFFAFCFFSTRLSHEISLYSLGRSYHETSGLNYNIFDTIITLLKGLIITLTFFLIGWLGGFGNYLQADHDRRVVDDDIKLLLILFTGIQIILSLSVHLDYKYIILITTVLSYASFTYRVKKDKRL
jgi:hypothetical protein